MAARWANVATPAVLSGAFGGVAFGWLVGVTVLDPLEYRWLFQGDWQFHFLGWHLFRNEPWQIPPGFIASYAEPVGTALAYTDSIPLVAFLLKPFASVLPNPLQYLGLWLLVCFILQGVLGSVLVGAWTRHPVLRTLGGCLFVVVPTLLGRLAHPALCSHWLLLWALWLAVRDPPLQGARGMAHHASLALASGLAHPYLAVMVLLVLVAVVARRAIKDRRAVFEAVSHYVTAVAVLIAGWWAAGILTITSGGDLIAAGVGRFSMNLLGLVNPGARSRFVPAMPWISPEQQWEGFHYLGAGLLVICVVAALRGASAIRRIQLSYVPLVVLLAGCAIYALSPRITFGDRVLVDLIPHVGEWSMFRATARFFWPVTYALVAVCVGSLAAALKPRAAIPLLAGALVFQVADLHAWYRSLHDGFRTAAFRGDTVPRPSATWGELLRHFKHVRLYMPHLCGGPAPVPMAYAAYLAGLYGLGVNDGFGARMDSARIATECQRLREHFAGGIVDDATVYLVAPGLLRDFQAQTSAASCDAIDGVAVCVSKRSADRVGLEW